MRIAILVRRFPVPSETFILDQVAGLIQRGHDVEILAESGHDQEGIRPDAAEGALLERTRYSGPVPANYAARLAKGLAIWVRHAHGDRLHLLRSLNVSRFGRQAASLRMLYRAASVAGAGPYDIVHCHFGPNGILGAALRSAGVLTGRLVTSFHGYDLTQFVRSRGPGAYAGLFEQGDLFLPVSRQGRDTLIRLGCDEDKIAVHHMGVDCRALAFRPAPPPQDGPTRILSVARLTEKKGLEYGIRAVGRVLRRGFDVQYNIVGDGPLRDRCARLIAELDIGQRIRLLGWRDRQETVRMLRESHLFLAPSVTGADGDQEGVPVALMEAMATGLPVVASRHAGIPELVQDGVCGRLVPERDVDGLADALVDLVEHPELWPGMGQAGRACVEEDYDLDKQNDRLIDTFRGLLCAASRQPCGAG
ncbi:MAG: glycosyltransferase [Phycisphaerae bacterium]|nr:glycosyltransferase [Phycisphaerae bacterium]